MLVGLDGLQIEKIAQAATPNLDKLFIKKGYTRGITGTSSEQATDSWFSWRTVITGGMGKEQAGIKSKEYLSAYQGA